MKVKTIVENMALYFAQRRPRRRRWWEWLRRFWKARL
jgi:hypothetical protein